MPRKQRSTVGQRRTTPKKQLVPGKDQKPYFGRNAEAVDNISFIERAASTYGRLTTPSGLNFMVLR